MNSFTTSGARFDVQNVKIALCRGMRMQRDEAIKSLSYFVETGHRNPSQGSGRLSSLSAPLSSDNRS